MRAGKILKHNELTEKIKRMCYEKKSLLNMMLLKLEGTDIVELKAVRNIENVHLAIARSYLKALGKG